MDFQPIEATYSLDPSEFMKDWVKSRIRQIWPWLALIFAALVYAAASAFSPSGDWMLFAVLIGIILGVLLVRWFQWRKECRNPDNRRVWEERNVTIDGESMHVRYHDGSDSRIVLKSLVGWDETERYFFLFISAGMPYPLAKAAFTEEESNRLLDLLKNRLALKRRPVGRVA